MGRVNKKSKIAIIGPYPPPYGGISVHVQRVLAYLDKIEYSYDFYLENSSADIKILHSPYSFYGLRKIISMLKLLFKKYYLIHHHSPDCKTRIILGIYGMLGKNVYLHIHGVSLEDEIKRSGIKSILVKKLLKFVNIIADNENIANLANKYKAKSIVTIDAFLPPLFEESIYKKFLANYSNLLSGKEYIIFMIGWFIYYEDVDLYGFDIALRALKKFKEEITQSVLLVASINGVRSGKLFRKIKKYIESNGLSNNILFIYEELSEIWPVYLASDVFIRPTCTDGSALSVKEALWFGTPVIASNCVPRPKSVILFENRSEKDLFNGLLQVYSQLDKNNNAKNKILKIKNKNFEYKLFRDIYKIESEGSNN